MIDLGDGTKWTKFYDQTHFAQSNSAKENAFFPITPVIISVPLDYYTVAIYSSVSNAKETWRFGGKVYPVIDVPGTGIVVGKLGRGYYVEINFPTIIQIAKVSLRYRIAFYFPKWFTTARLEAWVYTSNEPLGTIEDRLINIKAQLDRIEQGINTTTGQ